MKTLAKFDTLAPSKSTLTLCGHGTLLMPDRENGKMPINQTKGRNDGILSFELEAKFENMHVYSNQAIQTDDSSGDGTSPVSDIIG